MAKVVGRRLQMGGGGRAAGVRVARKGLRDGISECLALVVLVVIQMAWGIRPIDLAMAAMEPAGAKARPWPKARSHCPFATQIISVTRARHALAPLSA
jgi:hypothetical protein